MEYEWLWDCRGGGGGIGGGRRDYAKEIEVAVHVVQVACTLSKRVQTRSSSPTPAPAASTPSSTAPRSPSLEHKGCVMYAHKGCGQAWMQPLIHDFGNLDWHNSREIRVSSVSDPVSATFCEPVEKANSSHSFTAGLAHSVGLRKQPLRVYSMVKYAAIARGDAEIFMKFTRAGYKEKIWDHAAGVVIIQEAGGMITDAEAGR